MLYMIVIILFLSTFLMIYGLLLIIGKKRLNIEKRIHEIQDDGVQGKEDRENKSFMERMLKPVYQGITRMMVRTTPSKNIENFQRKLESAGLLKNGTKEKWLYIKGMLMLIVASSLGALVYTESENVIAAFLMFLFMLLFVNVFFNFFLSRKVTARRERILRDLPYTLDLITVSVEAGLSFDGAMARVVSNIQGDLCDEFGKSLKEIRMGIERKVALRNMSNRCEVEELSMFITSIIQADELGVSLGKVLRIESDNLREHRKQVVREKAMKAPVKMLFPLVFFIFPAIFIIILGPVVIQMMEMFAGGL
ncbi:type II secretion system F family protein [Isachenkonia alkalipeptolytica]|uniref:Type II secretion system F family protein n=1 Tax=Isachenkonia alkalipeptolytica TaxID=2565777 RepID=A0AA44BD37_9CLOT|nr:type II secretion system F family protein [Isachenkonia alkalipeptolytica]NBG87944.1 type II secretion system F family protein [Isachenkonia alkalipeptolytica]